MKHSRVRYQSPERSTEATSRTVRTMRQATELPWEIGGFFPWQPLPLGTFLGWPPRSVWYLLARQALLALLQDLGARTLWLPSYFCHDTAQTWASHVEVKYYEDGPRLPHAVWKTIAPERKDVVLAVNYFGMREGTPWAEWRSHRHCLLVEDHSHDPLSRWAKTSRADYAISSLRKVFPVPDGAILWSPVDKRLPQPPRDCCADDGGKGLAAMLFKADYLAGHPEVVSKEEYRRLFTQAEKQMDSAPISAPTTFALRYLAAGAPRVWRSARRNNFLRLLRGLTNWEEAQPLFSAVSPGQSPLGFGLIFPSQPARDSCRAWLESQNVYCPVHWNASSDSNAEVRDLAARVLTVPCDHRYSGHDMDRIVRILRWPKG